MRALKRHFRGRSIILLWDGLPAHRSGRMQRYVARQRAWLHVERRPAYAPDLNPVEQIWGNVCYVLSQVAGAGVGVAYYLDDRQPDLVDATGKFMEQVRNFPAEMEREKAWQRTADEMVKKAKAGHVTGGTCYGYRQARTPEGHVARWVYEPEANVVRQISSSGRSTS